MGSGQSAAAGFSVDPQGNITQRSSSQQSSSLQPAQVGRRSDSQSGQGHQHQHQHIQLDSGQQSEAVPVAHRQSNEPADNIPKANQQQEQQQQQIAMQPSAEKRGRHWAKESRKLVREADEALTKLEAAYHLDSPDMVGKQRSVFDEVERNLVQCYAANKHQPMNCSRALKEYQDYVERQRVQLLRKQTTKPTIPFIATIISVITICLLFNVTAITCYGAMSIDLGSEWMKVGLVAPSVQMDIVLNAQSQRKTAMAVAFSNGERFVGDSAMDVASKYPDRVFTHFLDLVGKSLEHESVEVYKNRFPYAKITSHQPNSTSILLNHPQGLSFTPLELIAMMIEHAHEQVTNRLNVIEPITDVVITVPPFFGKHERRVVADAAKLVGLSLLRLTNVNSAFALSYGIFRHKDYLPILRRDQVEQPGAESKNGSSSILFVDQGASHTSITLADYHLVEQVDPVSGASRNESLPVITIRAQVYDRYLGGLDMQLKLRDHLIEAFAKKTKIDEKRIRSRGKSMAKLLKEAARVKRVLSANTDHLVRVENVIDDKDLREPITRQEYETINDELLSVRLIKLLDEFFSLPDVSKDEKFESVIIIGGNTRTPKIQQVLLDYFKLDVLGKSVNADEGAALAALYQAASLGRGFRVKKFGLEEFGEKRLRIEDFISTPPTSNENPEPSTEAPSTSEAVPTEQQEGTTTPAPAIDEEDDAIYGRQELERVEAVLTQLRRKDHLRMQRLSLMNSLESLLSEARDRLNTDDHENVMEVGTKAELERRIKETREWLEDGPKDELDDITKLSEKFDTIHTLLHPPPPPPPPPSQTKDSEVPSFDPSTIDLSGVLSNGTMSILDALNFTNPFGSAPSESAEEVVASAESTPPTQGDTPPTGEHSTESPQPESVKPVPTHTEL